MKINKLEIQNFKCIENATIKFNSSMTVLIGDNGTGKTTILDALSFVLGAFLTGIDGTPKRPLKTTEKRQIHNKDVFVVQLPLRTTVQLSLLGEDYCYYLQSTKESGNPSYINAKKLIDKAKELTKQVRFGVGVNLPLMAYYNTTFEHKNKEVAYAKMTSRLIGYDDCLFPEVVSYKFLSWFKTFEDSKLKFNKDDGLYKAFTNAISSMIPEWKNIHYNWKEDDIVGQLDNVGWTSFRMLSDSYKHIIRIVADIAYRAIKLNPHLGINAVTETEGVVLIDGIDTHLHPKWQRAVVSGFKRTFPNIQFIVTTHSPQLLSSVHKNDIFILKGNKLHQPSSNPIGRDSSDILAEIMDITKRPDDIQKLSDNYFSLLNKKLFEEAQEVRNQLLDKLDSKDPIFIRADAMMTRLQLLKK